MWESSALTSANHLLSPQHTKLSTLTGASSWLAWLSITLGSRGSSCLPGSVQHEQKLPRDTSDLPPHPRSSSFTPKEKHKTDEGIAIHVYFLSRQPDFLESCRHSDVVMWLAWESTQKLWDIDSPLYGARLPVSNCSSFSTQIRISQAVASWALFFLKKSISN